MIEVNDNNVLMTPDTIEQLRYIEKVNFKRESKVDNPSKYRMVLNIILEEIRRHQEKNQPLLKGYLDSNSLYDKEYLKELEEIDYQIRALLETRGFLSSLKNKDLQKLEAILELLSQYEKKLYEMYLLFDLKNSEHDYLSSMKYYKTSEEIKAYKEEFRDLVDKKDILGLENLQKKIALEIKNEWERYVTPIEEMRDDNFRFIGHSTTSTSFDGDFAHPLVSTSLYNQDLNDTFNFRYGFILAPENIIMTGIDDLFVDNNATEESRITPFTRALKVIHPQRLIDECQKLKKENLANEIYEPVYNEVVIKGFNPQGLFCFTNGALEYDKAYRDVLKLRNSFPNLPLVVLDVMRSKTNDDLLGMQLELVNQLNESVIGSFMDISSFDIPRYQLFFEEFNKLKMGAYTKEDVARIFKKNHELISFFLEPDILFSGKYSDEEIKYALLYNYRYNIKDLLEGNVTCDTLINIATYLSPFIGRLNKYIPYLDEYVMIASHLQITDKMVGDIKKLDVCDFRSISLYLMPILKKELKGLKSKNNLKTKRLQNKKANLMKEEDNLLEKERRSTYYKQIKDKAWMIKGFTEEYGDTFLSLDNLDIGLNNIKIRIQKISEELSNLDKVPESTSVKERKEVLKRTLDFLRKDMECLEEARVHVDKRLVDVRLYLLELFGVDTLREVNDLVKEATNFLETKGPDNKEALRDIEAKLKQVNEQLTSLEKDQLRNRETFNSISGIEIETKKKR